MAPLDGEMARASSLDDVAVISSSHPSPGSLHEPRPHPMAFQEGPEAVHHRRDPCGSIPLIGRPRKPGSSNTSRLFPATRPRRTFFFTLSAFPKSWTHAPFFAMRFS